MTEMTPEDLRLTIEGDVLGVISGHGGEVIVAGPESYQMGQELTDLVIGWRARGGIARRFPGMTTCSTRLPCRTSRCGTSSRAEYGCARSTGRDRHRISRRPGGSGDRKS